MENQNIEYKESWKDEYLKWICGFANAQGEYQQTYQAYLRGRRTGRNFSCSAHGHTAAEIIYERADADKPFMGLTAFSGDFPTAKDVGVAKNYLTEEELKVLNGIVLGYFDFAEVQAMRRRPMYMSDYVEHLDRVLSSTGEKLLTGAQQSEQN